MVLSKKKLERLGGVGSILTGVMCSGIGWMDYTNDQAWKIWAIMTLVLIGNGVAMIAHAAKRTEDETLGDPVTHGVNAVKART